MIEVLKCCSACSRYCLVRIVFGSMIRLGLVHLLEGKRRKPKGELDARRLQIVRVFG